MAQPAWPLGRLFVAIVKTTSGCSTRTFASSLMLRLTSLPLESGSRGLQFHRSKKFGQQAAKRAEELEDVLNQLQDYKKGLQIHIDTIYQQGKRSKVDLTTL